MGNCTDCISDKDRAKHSTKHKSKHDKSFITFFNSVEALPFLKEYLPNQKILLKNLLNHKEKFEELYELAPDKTDTKERLLIDIQKGLDLCKSHCFMKKEVLVRVKLDTGEKHYETPLTDCELPTWYHFIELTEGLSKANFAKFTAYEHRERLSLKKLGECSVELARLRNQKIFYAWVNLSGNDPELESKILVKLQWIYDESQLYQELVEESSERIREITEYLKNYES